MGAVWARPGWLRTLATLFRKHMRKVGGGTLQARQAEAAPASPHPLPLNPPRGSEFTFVCPCWATQNFFVAVGSGSGQTAHVSYHGRAHFEASPEGRALLSPLECSQRETVLAQLDAEQARRAAYFDQVRACACIRRGCCAARARAAKAGVCGCGRSPWSGRR
jgi:hypothetical protein